MDEEDRPEKRGEGEEEEGGGEEEEEEEEEESLIHWLLLSRVIRDARLNGVH